MKTPLIFNIVVLQGGDTQSEPQTKWKLINSDPVNANLDKKWLETPLIFNIAVLQAGDTQSEPLIK